MPGSGADIEYQKQLRIAGYANGVGIDGARAEQLSDEATGEGGGGGGSATWDAIKSAPDFPEYVAYGNTQEGARLAIGAAPEGLTTGNIQDMGETGKLIAQAEDIGTVRSILGQAAGNSDYVVAPAPGVRLWPASTEFPTIGLVPGDLFPHIVED